MRHQRTAIFILVVLGALIAFWFWPNRTRLVAKYVTSPVPSSIRVVRFEGNELLLDLLPEPVCYLLFNGTREDIASLVDRSGFQPADRSNGALPGPAWWHPTGRKYFRVHRPSKPNSRLPIGANRHWNEFLWVDQTGTNVYFVLWGI